MRQPAGLKESIRKLPLTPGVYLMRDRLGTVIYVGKAKALRRRVASYFQASRSRRSDPKLRSLVDSVWKIEHFPVRSEPEAVLLESRLIKDFKPRYNVLWRDDKRFLLIRATVGETYPRFVAARIRRPDGARYFGPYMNTRAVRTTLRFLNARFGLRSCAAAVPTEEDARHCHQDLLKACTAPCRGKTSPEAYAERVRDACAFLEGHRPEVIEQVEADMRKAADAKDYERAAALRDMLLGVRGLLSERARKFTGALPHAGDPDRDLADLAGVLHLPGPPGRVQAFDLSSISGTHAVGSLVSFLQGRPDRKAYRHFRIRTVTGADDYAMLAEVLRRAYRTRREHAEDWPDIILIDGGKGHLATAARVLDELGVRVRALLSLAKRQEELFLYDRGFLAPVRLPSNSPALRLMQRLRDEAHRFALTYHRALRSRRLTESVLDEVAGIGPRRKREVLGAFHSIARLRRASPEEIAARVPGIGPALAAAILQALHERGAVRADTSR